jgi:hypothetical protein
VTWQHSAGAAVRGTPMNIVAFVVAFAIFVLGFWLFGLAFSVTSLMAPIFIGGIVCVSIAMAIPFHMLRN